MSNLRRNETDLIKINTAIRNLQSEFNTSSSVGLKNVTDYGAVGDGVSDDTAAIQAAIDDVTGNYTTENCGLIYFPAGRYKVTSSISYEPSKGEFIGFLGENGAQILASGSFNDFIFKRSSASIGYVSVSFQNLRITNNNITADDGCIYISNAICAKITNCTFFTYNGVGVESGNVQDLTIDTCSFTSGDNTGGSCGCILTNAATVINSDFIGWEQGIRHFNLGLNVVGGRFENNDTAIMIGRDADDVRSGSNGFILSGLSMESNHTAIYVDSGSSGLITASKITQFNAGGVDGIHLEVCNNTVLMGLNISGSYSGACVNMSSSGATTVDVLNVRAENVSGGGVLWLVHNAIDTSGWINTTYKLADNIYDGEGPPGSHDTIGFSTRPNTWEGITRFSNDAVGGRRSFAKSRGTATTALTALTTGDVIGDIVWYSADGTDLEPTAKIQACADGTQGSNDVPGRLEFYTTLDATEDPLLRMTIKNDGGVILGAGTTSPGTAGSLATPAFVEFTEMSAPSAGAANTARIFAVDNGSAKTQVQVQFASGSAITLATEGANPFTTVLKTTNETLATNTTLQDDDALTFAVAASTKYAFRMHVYYSTPTAADFKFQITGPSAPTVVYTQDTSQKPDNTSTADRSTGFSDTHSLTAASGTEGCVVIHGFLQNGANAGSVTLQWAQVSSSGTTTVYAGSYLEWMTVA